MGEAELSETRIIKVPEGKVCDYIDGKFRKDTQEEYVRQTIEKRLVNELKYPRDRMRVEFTLQVFSGKPRADIAIFPDGCTDQSQDNVETIIECKKESIPPSAKKDGVEQLKTYMKVCANCKWGLWTNGRYREVLLKQTDEQGQTTFVSFNDIPSANGSVEEVERPKRQSLKNASDDNLLFVFKTCHNHIYAVDGLEKAAAFFQLLKIIFCKIEDERNFPKPLEFYARSLERSNPDGQLTVRDRIGKIFERVKSKYGSIFGAGEEIDLKPRSLSWIVSELQGYSLLNTHIDIKGKAYEEIVGANLRGDKGQFFTPRNVMRMTVEMLNPTSDEKVLDPACGTGGFLVNAMNHTIEGLEAQMEAESGEKESWTDQEKNLIQNRVNEIAHYNYFGFDLSPELVKATKMNMVMNNDGSGNVLHTNSLLPPHEWEGNFKQELAKALRTSQSELTNHNKLEWFDVIVTNPPFGSKIPIKDASILSQYDLGHVWEKRGEGRWVKTEKLQGSAPPERLFIERCLQFLKPGGRMGIVLPDSILGSPGLGYIRQWLIEEAKIIASVDLHVDTFKPRNGTQTSILLVQKKTREEKDFEQQQRHAIPYNVFMAMVEKVGHDKRGNITFKRDENGDEIWSPEDQNVMEVGQAADGTATIKAQSKSRVIDDQTGEVPAVFAQWKTQKRVWYGRFLARCRSA